MQPRPWGSRKLRLASVGNPDLGAAEVAFFFYFFLQRIAACSSPFPVNRKTRSGRDFSAYVIGDFDVDVQTQSIINHQEALIALALTDEICTLRQYDLRSLPHRQLLSSPPVLKPLSALVIRRHPMKTRSRPAAHLVDPLLDRNEKRKLKKRLKEREVRREDRGEQCETLGQKSVSIRHAQNSQPIRTSYVPPQRLWTGPPNVSDRTMYTLEGLLGSGFRQIFWDGKTTHPILDRAHRLLLLLAACPVDIDWKLVVREFERALKEAEALLKFSAGHKSHRRGDYSTMGMGISFGGGQQMPANLDNDEHNAKVLEDFRSNWAVKRVVGYITQVFSLYYPTLSNLYSNVLDEILADNPLLIRNFVNSPFAGSHVNFGPRTCTVRHRDYLNLAVGACPIFAGGDYDHTLGGHLVIWDLKLIIEFPPGSLIIIPSALLEHSNLPIQDGEYRWSFAQYTAAGVFRWVHNGNMSDKTFKQRATKEEMRAWLDHRAKLWQESLGMMRVFSDDIHIIPL